MTFVTSITVNPQKLIGVTDKIASLTTVALVPARGLHRHIANWRVMVEVLRPGSRSTATARGGWICWWRVRRVRIIVAICLGRSDCHKGLEYQRRQWHCNQDLNCTLD